jgi:ssDNA-binding Zn-finger/Zn-ribbon topoisomerase 1
MYCPRCDKTIKKERLAQANRELKERFGSSALDKGLCPVCGCRLLDRDATRRKGE